MCTGLHPTGLCSTQQPARAHAAQRVCTRTVAAKVALRHPVCPGRLDVLATQMNQLQHPWLVRVHRCGRATNARGSLPPPSRTSVSLNGARHHCPAPIATRSVLSWSREPLPCTRRRTVSPTMAMCQTAPYINQLPRYCACMHVCMRRMREDAVATDCNPRRLAQKGTKWRSCAQQNWQRLARQQPLFTTTTV